MRTSPLDRQHRDRGAKMVPFGGWEMPLSYGEGTVAEHMACRQGCAIFDVSHLGTVRVTGPDAKAALQGALTNDLDRIGPGRAQYTHLLADDGSVADDIIVWWLDDEIFDVMPNAANTEGVRSVIGGDDITESRAVIAVQGPTARTVARAVIGTGADVGRFRIAGAQASTGTDVVVAGTGYTGEDGVEIAVPAEAAADVWEALVDAGAIPAGLGARDTLRLEAGLPLHGQDLGPGITPYQAGLGWVVRLDKGDFRGKAALVAEKEAGPARKMIGLVAEGRRPLRAGLDVLAGDEPVGATTSGSFSPVLNQGIALAFVATETADAALEGGAELSVDVRGKATPVTATKPPFIPLPSSGA